jgi:hypothetical protein
MTKETKLIKSPSEFLIEEGLLYSINKNVLHPLGLAMAVTVPTEEDEQEGNYAEISIWDYRDDKEGVLYGPDSYIAGEKKLKEFAESFGNKKIQERIKELGYIIQPHPDAYFMKDGNVELWTSYQGEDDSYSSTRFKVDVDWLQTIITERFGEIPLPHFIQSYDFDHSEIIYKEAKKYDMIKEEKNE